VGMHRSNIYRLVKTGDFPAPLRVGKWGSRWRRSEWVAWCNARPRANAPQAVNVSPNPKTRQAVEAAPAPKPSRPKERKPARNRALAVPPA
jgi:hypothetical protein